MRRLGPQLNDDVHVLTLTDRGEKVVGLKRQILLECATAEWVSFIDDDDLVAPDYCRRVGDVLFGDNAPDIVGFRLSYFVDGRQDGTAIHSYDAPKIAVPGVPAEFTRYNRIPNHLNPVRRYLALKAGYRRWDTKRQAWEYLSTGEDGDYARRLASLKPRPREVFLDWYAYQYLYVPQKRYAHLKT